MLSSLQSRENGNNWHFGHTFRQLVHIYSALICPNLDYEVIVYFTASNCLLQTLDSIQNTCLRLVLEPSPPHLSQAYIPSLVSLYLLLPQKLHNQSNLQTSTFTITRWPNSFINFQQYLTSPSSSKKNTSVSHFSADKIYIAYSHCWQTTPTLVLYNFNE